jgi:hypothetical protein
MIRRYPIVAMMVLFAMLPLRAQVMAPDMMAPGLPINIEFMSGPISLDSEPVTGAPYSAQAVTDIIQTLSDGNRIARQNKAQISRDGQGRTRREEGFAMFGPLVNGPRGNEPRNVQISDPVTGTMVMLDLQSRTAHKMPTPPRIVLRNKIAGVDASAAVTVEKMNVEQFEIAVPGPEARGGVMFNRMRTMSGVPGEKPVVESLGTQFMEGLAVEGTRTTVTIPAGQIGNERPIDIVSERWFSQDLKVLVMSRQSDPRFGETTYRLTNITRSEPAPQLFEIPADFKLVDPMSNRDVILERKILTR